MTSILNEELELEELRRRAGLPPRTDYIRALCESGEGPYEAERGYRGHIPEIKFLPVKVINRRELDFRPEVMQVPDDVAQNMDFSEPVECTAFRFGPDGEDDVSPWVTLDDGHHRTASAIQTGRPWLPVTVRAMNARGKKLNALIHLSKQIEASMGGLNEALSSGYEYKSEFSVDKQKKFIFQSANGDYYHVIIETSLTLFSGIIMRVDFYNYSESTRSDLMKASDVLGTGDAFRVFGTVIQIVKDYLARQEHPPSTLVFAGKADVPSRIKLYRRFAENIGKVLPNYMLASEAVNGEEIMFKCKLIRKGKETS